MSVRIPILAVLGSGAASAAEEHVAAELGRLAAAAGWAVLTGGRGGTMEAACRGAVEAGGFTIGILPGASLEEGSPNPWVKIALPTGLGMARNAINVLAADLCVAVGGAAGTLSEVALACKAGRKVWWWRPWLLDPPEGSLPLDVRTFNDETALLRAVEAALAGFTR